jgi:hypothetical protein
VAQAWVPRYQTSMRKMRPMTAFDPTRPAFIHDKLNRRAIDWKREWASHYREYALVQPDGTVEWDGRILDGWRPFLVPIAE